MVKRRTLLKPVSSKHEGKPRRFSGFLIPLSFSNLSWISEKTTYSRLTFFLRFEPLPSAQMRMQQTHDDGRLLVSSTYDRLKFPHPKKQK